MLFLNLCCFCSQDKLLRLDTITDYLSYRIDNEKWQIMNVYNNSKYHIYYQISKYYTTNDLWWVWYCMSPDINCFIF
jgi:hypothetical protein